MPRWPAKPRLGKKSPKLNRVRRSRAAKPSCARVCEPLQPKGASDAGYGAIGGATSALIDAGALGHQDDTSQHPGEHPALEDIHSAMHPARLSRAKLNPEEAPATVLRAKISNALGNGGRLAEALDAEARAEGETEE